MNPQKVLKKSVLRALTSSGSVIAGAGSLLLSVATVNPLPLILYSVGSAVWVYKAVSSGRYTRAILDEERTRTQVRVQDEQQVLSEQVESLLEQPSFQRWTRNGEIPDYPERYRTLIGLRHKIVNLAQDRPEIEHEIETNIIHQLDHMIAAYLKLVRSHILYFCVLLREDADDEAPKEEAPKRGRGRKDLKGDESHDAAGLFTSSRGRGPKTLKAIERPLPTLDARLSELQQRIDELRRLAEQQPGTRAVRQTHITLLEKQMKLLQECGESDQRVVAQLDTFVDAFELIYNRMSASQLAPSGITSFMGEVVQQVDETIQFAEALRPNMDQVFGDLNLATSAQ